MRHLMSGLMVFAMLQLAACCCGGPSTSSWESDWESTDWTANTCFQNVPSDKQTVGDTFSVTCPADCTFGSVWGSNPYTGDSNICVAAVHAGKLTATGGTVDVKVVAGQDSYEGTTANGVTSSTWPSYAYSFTF